MTVPQPSSLVTRQAATQLLNVSLATVDRMIKSGRLLSVRPSQGRVLVPYAEILRLLTPVNIPVAGPVADPENHRTKKRKLSQELNRT